MKNISLNFILPVYSRGKFKLMKLFIFGLPASDFRLRTSFHHGDHGEHDIFPRRFPQIRTLIYADINALRLASRVLCLVSFT